MRPEIREKASALYRDATYMERLHIIELFLLFTEEALGVGGTEAEAKFIESYESTGHGSRDAAFKFMGMVTAHLSDARKAVTEAQSFVFPPLSNYRYGGSVEEEGDG